MYYSEYYVNDIHHHLKPEVLPFVPASRFNPKASFKYALRPAFGMAAVGVTATVDVTDCGPTPAPPVPLAPLALLKQGSAWRPIILALQNLLRMI